MKIKKILIIFLIFIFLGKYIVLADIEDEKDEIVGEWVNEEEALYSEPEILSRHAIFI